jgi:outer membrane protein TolC
MHRKRFAAVCALAIAEAFGLLFAQTVLTMDQAVDWAVKNNLSLQRTLSAKDEKKRASDVSWNSLIPAVSASSAVSKANADGSKLIPAETISASLSLSPAIASSMKRARIDYESGAIDYEAAKRSLDLSVRKAFCQILLFKEQIAVYERKIETAKSQYDQTAAKARVGQASQLELLRAQVNWETLKPNLKNARVSYENTVDDFKQAIGAAPETDIVLEGTLAPRTSAAEIAKTERNGDPQNVVALRKSIELTQAEKQAASDRLLMPTLNLSYSAAPTYADDEWNDRGSFSAAVGINLDGFLPWSATKETLNKYEDTISSLSSRIIEAQRKSDTTIRQLRRSIEKSLNSIDALVLNVRLAEKSYAMYEESYQKGMSDLQSLKDAGDTLVEAKANVLQEQYALAASILDLEAELNVPFGTLGRT